MAFAPEWLPRVAAKCWQGAGQKAGKDLPLSSVERSKLPRNLSLKSRVEISRLFKKGNKISGECFTCYWAAADQFRYGLFLSRRHGNAVERNRIKRLFRESIRVRKSLLKSEITIAVVPSLKARKLSLVQIDAEISRIFKRIKPGT